MTGDSEVYRPTVGEVNTLLGRIPEKYIPPYMRKPEHEDVRFSWLDNKIYLLKMTGRSWDKIKDLKGDKLVSILFPV